MTHASWQANEKNNQAQTKSLHAYLGGHTICGYCGDKYATVEGYVDHLVQCGPDPDDTKGSDACYAEGVRRV